MVDLDIQSAVELEEAKIHLPGTPYMAERQDETYLIKNTHSGEIVESTYRPEDFLITLIRFETLTGCEWEIRDPYDSDNDNFHDEVYWNN
jgi:hypothetical protein